MASDTTPDETLPAVLRQAAAEVIIDKGLGAFSIREVARRAGVSHAAPGYHFGDTSGLLTALAIEGLTTLHESMATAASEFDDPIDQLTAVGRAYVNVSSQYPAHCEVIFREDLIDIHNAEVEDAGLCAVGVLHATISEIAARHNPDLAIDDAVKLCWSAMQGLVQIAPKFARGNELVGQPPTSTDELVERFTNLIINGLLTS